MKINTITCHCPHNFGAVLQSYALQSYLERIGHDARIIDYRPNYLTKNQKLSYVGNKRIKSNPILYLLYLLLNLPTRIKRIRNYKKFENSYLKLSPNTYYTYNELSKYPSDSDLYICGSDQIWNTDLPNGNDESYYLSFVKDDSKKASYAASMSIATIDDNIKVFLSERIKDFAHVSVREDTAKAILEPIINKKITHVLDPVFLLSDLNWKEMSDVSDIVINEKYILLYIMGDNNMQILEIAKQIATQRNIKIYLITNSIKSNSGVDRCFRGESPNTFLKLISNAQFVITNSFHGTAFSIIFNKQFISCHISKTNSRIKSLLQLLDLKSRYMGNEDVNIPNQDVDYDNVNILLKKEIEISKQYIEKITD